jgi:hypothetical protein
MCKLCGKQSKSLTLLHHPRTPRSELSLQFCNIVFEYTGNYPCYTCNALYLQAFNTYKTGIDDYIVSKLFTRCKPINITTRVYNKQVSMLRMFKSKGCKQPSYNKPTKTIEKNIMHNETSFIVQISRKSKRYLKSFSTLEESQHYKQEILNGKHNSNTTV